jgi:hypothetical protein
VEIDSITAEGGRGKKERKKERKIVYFLNTALTYSYYRLVGQHGVAIF